MNTKIIYEPRGKALEYAPLAANLYKGCGHGCTYCWVPSATFQKREGFCGNPRPRPGVIEALEKDAERLAGDKRPVLLCFSCDPYQPINDEHQLTRKAIQVFNRHGLAVHILTKRGSMARFDFDLLSKNANNAYAVTLTHASAELSRFWEPSADLPAQRIDSLRIANSRGIQTWVSFEPVLNPQAVFDLIDETYGFVDLYKVGKWNYDARARDINWPKFREDVAAKLKNLGKPYLIKKDLAEAV